MRGEVPKVESHRLQQVVLKQNTVVNATEWKVALLHMFVWFDFISMLQCNLMVAFFDPSYVSHSALGTN